MAGKSQDVLARIVATGVLVLLAGKFLFFPGSRKSGQDLVVHAITEAGGRVQVDENAPDKPVVRVDLEGSRKTSFLKFAPLGDEGLAQVRHHLESLPRLRYLRITSMAMISDAGLRHLEGLTQLETMELYGDKITESGVNQLRKKLPHVHILYSGPGQFPNLAAP